MQIHGTIKNQTPEALKSLNPVPSATPHAHAGPEWALVLDERQAWLFAYAGRQVTTLGRFSAHEAARTTGLNTASDGAHMDHGRDQSRYEPPITQTRQHELRFVHEVAQWLHRALDQKAFTRLFVVAGPRMLGEWRKEADNALLAHVAAEIHHDLASYGEARLRQELPRYLPGPDSDRA